MRIRPERAGDERAIHRLTLAAFEPMSYSDGTEAAALDALRRDGDLTLSLVALDGDEIVGHVAFSPVTVDGSHDGWYGLGPVAVRPGRQRTGIGTALIEEGLARLRARGARGCALIGDPSYYRRFGFRGEGALRYRDVSARYVQWLAFDGSIPEGRLRFSPGLE